MVQDGFGARLNFLRLQVFPLPGRVVSPVVFPIDRTLSPFVLDVLLQEMSKQDPENFKKSAYAMKIEFMKLHQTFPSQRSTFENRVKILHLHLFSQCACVATIVLWIENNKIFVIDECILPFRFLLSLSCVVVSYVCCKLEVL